MTPFTGDFSPTRESLGFPCSARCLNCSLPEYLLTKRQWQYVLLPNTGLKSMVFQGSSPLFCAASGNVWLDYPNSDTMGCLAHETVLAYRERDNKRKEKFDWRHFDSSGQLCLRMTKLVAPSTAANIAEYV